MTDGQPNPNPPEADTARYKVAVLVTTTFTIRAFYRLPLYGFKEAGIDVTVISAADGELGDIPPGVRFAPCGLTRTSTPLRDLNALWQLYRHFRAERYDLIQYSTPKASLLGSIAACAARIPTRLYLNWGLYYEGKTGWKRRVFQWIEWITSKCSTQVIPNSQASLDTLVADRIVRREKCTVIRHGSPCGIDLNRFNADEYAPQHDDIRASFELPSDAIVLGVLGRLTGDKGLHEIVGAFCTLAERHPNLYMLIVGMEEEKDRLREETSRQIREHPRIKHFGWRWQIVPFYAAIDIFCLPSYREGLPQSVLEAQAMGKPVVCSDIAPCREAIEEEVTGLLAEVRSTQALIPPLERLISDAALRERFGAAARERIRQRFRSEDVLRDLVDHRLAHLRKRPPREKK